MTLTPLSCFNELLRLTAAEADEDSLALALRAVEDELDRMSSVFHTECVFHEDSPAVQAEIREVYQLYDELFEGLRAFRAQRQGLEDCAQTLNAIYDAYARIRALSPPPASESPYLAELVRVAWACQAGSLPWEALDARLAAYQANFHAFVQAYEEQELERRQWALTEAQRQAVTACLQRINDCLLDLEEDCLDSLGELVAANAELMGIHAQIREQLERPVSFCCPRCGAETGGTARVCARCGATLPRRVEETSTLELHSEHPEPVGIPTRLKQLGDDLEAFLGGSLQLEDFVANREELLTTAEQVERQLEALDPPPEGALEELLEARRLLQEGQRAYRAHLEQMLALCAEGFYDGLRDEYERLLGVGTEMLGLQRLNSELQAKLAANSGS